MSRPTWSIGSTYYAFSSCSGTHGGTTRAERRGIEWFLTEAELYGRFETSGPYSFNSFAGNHRVFRDESKAGGDTRGLLPFVHFVVKVVSRCNIKCSYCYMYEGADQTWRSMPLRMSEKTETSMIDRVADYAAARELPEALMILHGGEPLLYGPERIGRLAERVRRVCDRSGTDMRLALQTNATMIDDASVDVLTRHRVQVGISLDGPPKVHDAARRDMRGGRTHERVVTGLRKLIAATSRGLPPPAVTAVIDPAIRPRELIDHFLDLGVEHVDFQLPDLNHDTYRRDRWPTGTFGGWLIELYEELWKAERPLRVRSLELLIRLLMGAPFGGDILGRRSFGTLVIDTDGSYHAHDSLRATFDGATLTGSSVHTDEISSVEHQPMVVAFTDKASAATGECRACPLFTVCGGGLPAHRYSAERGFDNPSVYCGDLAMLIRHVDRSVQRWRRHQ